MSGWRKKQVLELALEALEAAEIDGNCEYGATEIIRKALAQPEQEHITCIEYIPCCTDKTCPKCKATTPPQRKPLGEHEITKILDHERMKWNKSPPTHEFDLAFARAIEAAHGIKE